MLILSMESQHPHGGSGRVAKAGYPPDLEAGGIFLPPWEPRSLQISTIQIQHQADRLHGKEPRPFRGLANENWDCSRDPPWPGAFFAPESF
jgi:hypothetical protein